MKLTYSAETKDVDSKLNCLNNFMESNAISNQKLSFFRFQEKKVNSSSFKVKQLFQ